MMAQPYPDDAVTTMGPDMNEATEVIGENREMRRRRKQRERMQAKLAGRQRRLLLQAFHRFAQTGDVHAWPGRLIVDGNVLGRVSSISVQELRSQELT